MYLSGIQTEIAKKSKMLILPLALRLASFKAQMGAQHRRSARNEAKNQTHKKHFAFLK